MGDQTRESCWRSKKEGHEQATLKTISRRDGLLHGYANGLEQRHMIRVCGPESRVQNEFAERCLHVIRSDQTLVPRLDQLPGFRPGRLPIVHNYPGSSHRSSG